MKKVLCFGAFDIIHPGHLNFFRNAKAHGDYLIVVVGRDDTVERIKGSQPKYTEKSRRDKIAKLGVADEVTLGYHDDPYRIIEEKRPDVICLGYDQDRYTEELEKELRKRNVEAKIIRLSAYRPEVYKSSKLR